MSSIEKKLEELGLKLDDPKPPAGNYVGSKVSGQLLFASGRVSDLIGVIGSEVSEEAAKKASRDTVLLILAIVKKDLGQIDVEGSIQICCCRILYTVCRSRCCHDDVA